MSNKPNVIWIFGDQHRAQSLGYMGDPNVSTPHLNRLADEGITFTSAVAGFPLCSPFRGALISAQYPHKVNAWPPDPAFTGAPDRRHLFQ